MCEDNDCDTVWFDTGDRRNKTRLAKVVLVAKSKQKCSVRTHNVVKYTSKNFGYVYTLYWVNVKFFAVLC